MNRALVAFCVFSTIFLVVYFKRLESNESRNWQAVEGIVLEAYVTRDTDWRKITPTSLPTAKTKYDAVVKYEYTVDGVTYYSDRVRVIKKRFSLKSEANEFIKSFQVGHSVPVYFDQKNHANSVLVRG